jgi:hypothetical protein
MLRLSGLLWSAALSAAVVANAGRGARGHRSPVACLRNGHPVLADRGNQPGSRPGGRGVRRRAFAAVVHAGRGRTASVQDAPAR